MINYNNDKSIDPKWYDNDGSEKKHLIKILVIILLVAAVAWVYGTWKENQRIPPLPGEVILKGDMNISAASGLLQEAGYIPESETQSDDLYYHQYYKSSEVLGYPTEFSMLAVSTTGSEGVHFVHYFTDDSKENNADNPGETYRAIASALADKIGEYPTAEKSQENSYVWKLNKKTRVRITYADENIFWVDYQYIR